VLSPEVMKHSKIVIIIFFFLLFVKLITKPPFSPRPGARRPGQNRPQNRIRTAETPFFAPQSRDIGRATTPQEPFSPKIGTGLARHPQNAASGCFAAMPRPLAAALTKNDLSGSSVFSPRQTGFTPGPDLEFFPAPYWAGEECRARESALLVGVCRVGWGSRPRSSRQGGVSPPKRRCGVLKTTSLSTESVR
jgi:hypothetical protein